jgi:hypothetical protein
VEAYARTQGGELPSEEALERMRALGYAR